MHVDGGHRQEPIDFQRRHFENGPLVAIWDFLASRLLSLNLAVNINSKLQWHNAYVYG